MADAGSQRRAPVAVCTIIALNYLPVARILARSVRRLHPDFDFYVVVVDRPHEARQLSVEGIRFLTIEDIDFLGDDYRRAATMYDVTEFSTSIKPRVLGTLLHHHETVLYMDPDTKLYARLDALVASTVDRGWSLTPHCLAPVARNGAGPTEQEIMGAGTFNLGYIGVTNAASHVLDWWWERLRRHALIAQPEQMFTDQRWIDLAAAMYFPYVESSGAYNVAYWNLDQRRLWFDGDVPMVDDEPLRFFHFSGYDPDEPWWMSKYQRGTARVLMSDNPAHERLFEDYRVELVAERDIVGSTPTYGWRDALPGLTLHRGIRRMYRRELMEAESSGGVAPPSPFVPEEFEGFLDWLKGRDPRPGREIPRHVSAVIDVDPEVSGRFAVVNDGNRADLHGWVRHFGAAKHPSLTMLPLALAETSAETFVRDTGERRKGVDVVGYLHADLGVGEAARLVSHSLRSVGVDVSLSAWSRTSSRLGETSVVADNAPAHRTALLAVNADQLPHLREVLGDSFYRGRRIIGQWFWELEQAPQWFGPAFRHVDEIWAPTRFIETTVRSVAPSRVDVVLMPLPITEPDTSPVASEISGGPYTFLYVFDYLSVMKRKNPLGLIRAFMAAFPNEGEARLVLKTINAAARVEDAERVRWECRHRRDILIIDEYRTRPEVARLMADADCYVSLHRSEGLGLTIAEAMALGKPVIATHYSGNVDFMDDRVSVPIPWARVPVGEGAEGYPAAATWAEPDIGRAAEAMADLARNPAKGIDLGRRAREHVLTEFSPERVGRRMAERLQSQKRRSRAR